MSCSVNGIIQELKKFNGHWIWVEWLPIDRWSKMHPPRENNYEMVD